MEIKVDLNQYEQQRYNAIKQSGQYIEFGILIGTENVKYKDGEGRMPIVSLNVHNCSRKEIMLLYSTLMASIEKLEEDYPLECFLGKMALKPQDISEDFEKFNDEEEK